MTNRIPTTPALSFPITKTDVDALMRTLSQMQVAIEQMPRWTSRDVTIQAPTTDAPRVLVGLTRRPKSVLLGAFDEINPSFGPVGLSDTLRWDYDSGHIILPQLAGLTGTATYRLRLLIEEA